MNATISSTKRLIIKRDQTEILKLRNAMNERKNTIQNFNSRLKPKKRRSCELEDKSFRKKKE